MSQLSNVWIFDDQPDSYPELMAAASSLGATIYAITLDDQNSAMAFALGVEKVYQLNGKPSENIIEDYAQTIANLIKTSSDTALLLLPNSRSGKALSAKIGGALGAGVVNDISAIVHADGHVKVQHMVYGGLAIESDAIHSDYAVVTVNSGTFAPQAADESKSGSATAVEYLPPANAIRCVERRPKEGSQVDLNKATRVVGVGRGIAQQEDLTQVEELAAALGSELGCTRPIAEGEKWMDRDRYIGVSGVMLKPDVYLALGVSGQIQHMVGVNTAQTIIAVNKDKNAPIFKVCDYGLVGDLYKVVPALIAAFNKT